MLLRHRTGPRSEFRIQTSDVRTRSNRFQQNQKSDVIFPPSDEGGGSAALPPSRRERQNQIRLFIFSLPQSRLIAFGSPAPSSEGAKEKSSNREGADSKSQHLPFPPSDEGGGKTARSDVLTEGEIQKRKVYRISPPVSPHCIRLASPLVRGGKERVLPSAPNRKAPPMSRFLDIGGAILLSAGANAPKTNEPLLRARPSPRKTGLSPETPCIYKNDYV